MSNSPVVVEALFDATIKRVWKAITDKEEMKFWYFDIHGFKPEPGCSFTFAGGASNGTRYIHLCTIMEVLDFCKLSYTWRYDGYEGNSLITFELFPKGEHTKLRLTHEGLNSFPESNPDFARHNFEEGWKHIIGTNLFKYLTETR